MVSKTLKLNKAIQLDSIVHKLEQIGMSVEVKMEQTGQLTSLLIEKYFMRNSNVSCCSVCIYSHSEFEHDVIVMSGGSSQGAFLKLSWGADTEFLDGVCDILESASE